MAVSWTRVCFQHAHIISLLPACSYYCLRGESRGRPCLARRSCPENACQIDERASRRVVLGTRSGGHAPPVPNVCPVPQPGPESPKRCDEVWGKPHRTLILGMGKPRHRALKRPAPAQEQLGCQASAVPTGTQNLPRLCRRARHGWVALSKLEVTLGPLGFAGLCDVSPPALPLLPSARLLCR